MSIAVEVGAVDLEVTKWERAEVIISTMKCYFSTIKRKMLLPKSTYCVTTGERNNSGNKGIIKRSVPSGKGYRGDVKQNVGSLPVAASGKHNINTNSRREAPSIKPFIPNNYSS